MSQPAFESSLVRGELNPPRGFLAAHWRAFRPEVIIGHPTFRNADNIRTQLAGGIRGAAGYFRGRRVAFVVSDGSWTQGSKDTSTVDAALAGARQALAGLGADARANIQVIATPYEGYGGDRTPGKGSALKMIFDEMEDSQASMLILLDGDLRNDMAAWLEVFAAVERAHAGRYPDRPFFVTARYARHFVDASLTRFVVGPLTTLMGRYVPGGISGDIVLSAGAVAHERAAEWTEARRKYGTDISTTFDNLADPDTIIYEVYLGAKLHDITDEAKLSVMPGEVIGAALERLLHWEQVDGRVTRGLGEGALAPLEAWGPERTGIGFIDPGATGVFDVDAKITTLLDKWPAYRDVVRVVLGGSWHARLEERIQRLEDLRRTGTGELVFLGLGSDDWIDVLDRAVAHALARRDTEAPRRCLNYLYTAAFLEFVRERLCDLGHRTLDQVRAAQSSLAVPPDRAEAFYRDRVDGQVDRLAHRFHDQRARILDLMQTG